MGGEETKLERQAGIDYSWACGQMQGAYTSTLTLCDIWFQLSSCTTALLSIVSIWLHLEVQINLPICLFTHQHVLKYLLVSVLI